MATIYDVARLAGVSVGTVSRYINNSGYVGRQSRERVAVAIEELGFRPNSAARSLTTKRTGMIGFLVSDLANPFIPDVARGVQDIADTLGYCALIYNTDGNGIREARALALLRDRQVDGVIVTPPETMEGDQAIRDLHTQGMPIVLLGRQLDNIQLDRVTTDTYSGALAAITHLTDLGHTRIALLCGDQHTATGRRKGYLDGLAAAGLPIWDDLIIETPLNREGGISAMTALLRLRQPPTAIFAVNDLVALGAMQLAIRRGIAVPGDLSVVGFDDIMLAEHSQPALTTIAQPKFQLGKTAFELLHTQIEQGRADEPQEIRLACELIRRESTAMARAVSFQLGNNHHAP